jgi:enamine deaminase RidA (YjgF/YER057c/UK114 family)/phenylpyruvate tautomerase PptA (4-oxalocrotonate tautomerase family)
MPIANVTLIGALDVPADDLAQRLADALSQALDAPRGTTWVRVHRVDARDYAEDGGATAGAPPVFVDLLRRAWPASTVARATSMRAVADAVARACGRPAASVHVLAEAPAAGRVAFGGALSDGATRDRASSGAKWEAVVGYCRAVRVGELVFVTGTTAVTADGGHADADDAYAQATVAIANVQRALAQLGVGLEHVVRTRMFVTDIARDWQAVGRAHAEAFRAVLPATSMIGVAALIEPWMRVEIEVDAVAG